MDGSGVRVTTLSVIKWWTSQWTFIIVMLYSLTKGDICCTSFPDDPACGCTFKDGKTLDLRNEGSQDGQPAFSFPVYHHLDAYMYYNPCYPFTIPSGCTNVALCLEYQNVEVSISLGTQNPVFTIVNEEIVIMYPAGDNGRSSEVTLKCGSGASKFSFIEENPVSCYKFTLTCQCACFGHSNNLTNDLLATCSKTISSSVQPSPTSISSNNNTHNSFKYTLYFIIGAVVVVGAGIVLAVIIVVVVVCCMKKGHKCDYKEIRDTNRNQHKTIKDVYQNFRMRLILSLPMDDTIFSGLLREQNLLPGDLKEQVKTMGTRAGKAELFLERVIESPLNVGNCEPFNSLLTVMSDEQYNNNDALKQLATTIKQALANI